MKFFLCLVVISSWLLQGHAVKVFINKYCMIPAAISTCKAHAREWVVDGATRVCKMYYEYQCNITTAKSFRTEEHCQKTCLPPAHRRIVCSVPPLPAPCPPSKKKWYFNPETGYCKQFPSGLCGANANAFSGCETCTMRCTNLNIETVCPRYPPSPPLRNKHHHAQPGAHGRTQGG
uniref:Putative bilaris n=1 Tax=Rhipicephalus pulchellus TaxID=72859 RepID=L7LQN9_RHIPC